MTTTGTKPIHPDIPTDRAWKAGRRLYIRCGYKSQLNDGLRKLGAHWDSEERALWVGSGKLDAVVELVQAAETRIKEIEGVKALARWVEIPYDAATIRDHAKGLGAIWDRDHKLWALPNAEAEAEVVDLVKQRREKIKAQDQAARVAADLARRQGREAEKAAAAARAETHRDQVIAASGRTPTGETATVTQISTRRMNRRQAEAAAYPLGHLVKLRGGRRGIVTDVEVWFTDEESASSTCWHDETHDEAHWDLQHTLTIVESTQDEQRADATEQAEREDANRIHQLMEQAGKLTDSRPHDYTRIPAEDRVLTIAGMAGGGTRFRTGELILTRDGRAVWQHPGHYDDYVLTEGTTRDPDVVQRVQAMAEGGNRKRLAALGQLPVEYTVTVHGQERDA